MMKEDEYYDPDIAHNTCHIKILCAPIFLPVAVVDYGFLDNCRVSMILRGDECSGD